MNYREFPAPVALFDTGSKVIFSFLLRHKLLQETYKVLDVGCGPLRIGRHLILFLDPGCYYGVEPAEQILREGLEKEVIKPFGKQLLEWKNPTFSHVRDFDFSSFGTSFDLVYAYQVFIHCGVDQLRQCLRSVRRVLNGKFVFTVWLGRDAQIAKTKGTRFHYEAASHSKTFYRKDTLEGILKEEGMTLDFMEKSDEHVFYWVVVR